MYENIATLPRANWQAVEVVKAAFCFHAAGRYLVAVGAGSATEKESEFVAIARGHEGRGRHKRTEAVTSFPKPRWL